MIQAQKLQVLGNTGVRLELLSRYYSTLLDTCRCIEIEQVGPKSRRTVFVQRELGIPTRTRVVYTLEPD